MCLFYVSVFFFKRKTAYEMRISDWSSDVCSSDLHTQGGQSMATRGFRQQGEMRRRFVVRRRDAHQPAHVEAEFFLAASDKGVGVERQNPRLLRLLARIDLDQTGQAATGACHLGGERLGEPRTVERLDHIEQEIGRAHV